METVRDRPKPREPRKSSGNIHQVEDDDGWTHVIRGPPPQTIDSRTVTVDPTDILQGPALDAKLELYARTWRASPALAQHRSFFRRRVLPLPALRLDRCVVLALGSFATSFSVRGQRRDRGRSLSQLVALESWLALLRPRFPIERVVFQDPAFADADRACLEARGYEVVDDPKAQALVSPRTFVFAPCAPAALAHWVARLARPPLWVAALPEGEDRVAGYDRWALPEFEHSNWHTGMAVFTSTELATEEREALQGADGEAVTSPA